MADQTAWQLLFALDDNFAFQQFFLQPLILPAQFLVLYGQSVVFKFGPTFVRERVLQSRIWFDLPTHQGHRQEAFSLSWS